MTRNEVYIKCIKLLPEFGEGFVQHILPDEAIDAIIDCAVEEAVKAVMELRSDAE